VSTVSLVLGCRCSGRSVCRLVGVRHTRAETDSSQLRVATYWTPPTDILRPDRNRKDLLGAQTGWTFGHIVSFRHSIVPVLVMHSSPGLIVFSGNKNCVGPMSSYSTAVLLELRKPNSNSNSNSDLWFVKLKIRTPTITPSVLPNYSCPADRSHQF